MPPIEIPTQVTPECDDGYLEELTKAIFRSGFSWQVIRNKWDNFRIAFDKFQISKIASYGGKDITRLLGDAGIVRNQRKILATVDNARTILELAAEHGSVYSYLRSMDNLDYHQRVRVLTTEFAYLGRTGAFVFLYCVNEETPDWHQR